MKHHVLIAAAIAGLAALSSAGAQAHSYKREVPDSLAKQTKITEDAAVATAKKRIPSGTIQALELEKEKGKLIYSFDVKVPGKSGTDEVNVDAVTGKVIGVHHESPEAEKKEAAEDAKAKAKKP